MQLAGAQCLRQVWYGLEKARGSRIYLGASTRLGHIVETGIRRMGEVGYGRGVSCLRGASTMVGYTVRMGAGERHGRIMFNTDGGRNSVIGGGALRDCGRLGVSRRCGVRAPSENQTLPGKTPAPPSYPESDIGRRAMRDKKEIQLLD